MIRPDRREGKDRMRMEEDEVVRDEIERRETKIGIDRRGGRGWMGVTTGGGGGKEREMDRDG